MKAWEKLEQSEWIQGMFAGDKNGNRVSPESYTACQFCISGVLYNIYDDPHELRAARIKVTDRIKQKYPLYMPTIPFINNTVIKSKDEAVALLKEADV